MVREGYISWQVKDGRMGIELAVVGVGGQEQVWRGELQVAPQKVHWPLV